MRTGIIYQLRLSYVFFFLFALIGENAFSQNSNLPEWIPFNSYLEGRAKVVKVESDLVGYQWEFKIRQKLYEDNPNLLGQKIYVVVHQTAPIHLTQNKGAYNYDTPLRICFFPSARNKTYVAPEIFWMRRSKSDQFESYEWKEGELFPIADRGGQKFYHWGASLRVDQVNSENGIRTSQERFQISKYINVE
ncbi:MAG: hypothetical protein MUF12_05325 [Sediminibacterium sp.]|jgi:hypothetical protein|nr:hypothetical protein [Sediminibacterium sp.]